MQDINSYMRIIRKIYVDNVLVESFHDIFSDDIVERYIDFNPMRGNTKESHYRVHLYTARLRVREKKTDEGESGCRATRGADTVRPL